MWANKNSWTYKKVGQNWQKLDLPMVWSIFINSGQLFYMSRVFIRCILWCTRSPKKNFLSEVPSSMVIPQTSFSIVFGLSQIEKWPNLGPKSWTLIHFWISMGSQLKKLGIIAPKAVKTQRLVKSMVNPGMRAWGPLGVVMISKMDGSFIGR